MTGLNALITAARKVAQKWTSEHTRNPKVQHPTASLGATEGQALWLNPAGRLEMLPCWMEIRLANFHGTGEYKIALSPLLPVNKDRPVQFRENVYLDDVLLNDLTGHHHAFGGQTVEFRPGVRTDFDLDKDIEPQLYSYARNWTTAFEYHIYENGGEMILVGNTTFSLGETIDSYTDEDNDYYISDYDELVFIELDNDEREALLSGATNTGRNAIIVPTVWIKDNGERECFLDFAADWSQNHYGKRVTGRVGKFIVSHEVYNDKLLMQTSLRSAASAFAQTAV